MFVLAGSLAPLVAPLAGRGDLLHGQLGQVPLGVVLPATGGRLEWGGTVRGGALLEGARVGAGVR